MWHQTFDYSIKYFRTGRTVEKYQCAYTKLDHTVDLVIKPAFGITLTKNTLLSPISVKHEILASEYNGNGNAGISYPEISAMNGQYLYDDSDIYKKVIKYDCYENHKGQGNISTTLNFMGKEFVVKNHFSWKGV